ncbi:L-aspartate oxidase [Rhizobium sp. FKY42]|uniref:L-aspartate oxidase n=1 Tax=Rhizobium sp. FKY42 TaxID=2562310 RepID=UPI0010BFE061|nr:L-aspartate oxidase [Rhizobium sp. FKY42]
MSTASTALPVVVIGSGIAGLTTALALAPHHIVLVTKARLGEQTSSAWAQGGIAAAMGADDSVELHLNDTLAAGDGLVDEQAASFILSRAADAVSWLEAQGASFDRQADGTLSLGLEAAHCRRRIVHASGDASGASIVNALIRQVLQTPSITVLEGAEAERLLVTEGRVCGLSLNVAGSSRTVLSSAVVLATGGIGGLYEATTNPIGNFGQGIALAARAGAALADLEFVQFHPTALASPRTPLALISEAVRGEGAALLNERGERFMADVPGAELASRDVVARAISAEIGRGGRVFLDARSTLGHRFAKRFPSIAALCQEAGIDPARDAIPVRPAVHYHMGGVATDLAGRTSVGGLWAVGEVAATGLHGANRLASNSLLEATVMGLSAARDIASAFLPSPPAYLEAPEPRCGISPDAALRALTTRSLGVLRNEAGLTQAVNQFRPLALTHGSDAAIVALAIGAFALERRESRGAHARTDFPQSAKPPVRQRMTLSEIIERTRALENAPLARSA